MGGMALKSVSASKPSMFSGSKPPGAGLFKKPGMMVPGKKKFQMDVAAPTESDKKVMQKVETKLMAPKIVKRDGPATFLSMPQKNAQGQLSKASFNQVSGTSLGDKRVADGFLRPVALKEKTQLSLA